MARDHHHLSSHGHHQVGVVVGEEEYIDMDINNSATFLCYTFPSPPHSREFEFHMSSDKLDSGHIPSPADELFYKGNLLPLHLPPRLQMVEKLLQNSPLPFTTTTPTTTTTTTPFQSCTISPATSCYVSGELNADDYFFDCPSTKELFVEHHATKKSWSKKLKSIKQSSITLKLKASKAYLKSLFTKTACSDDNTAAAITAKASDTKSAKKSSSPIGQIQRAASFMRRVDGVKEECGHRRSFSEAIIKRRISSNKSSSSASSSSCSSSNSSSFSSVNSYGPQQPVVAAALKRSSSVSSDNECSIQGAIAYCKKSQQQQQQQSCGRKSVSDVEFYLLSEAQD